MGGGHHCRGDLARFFHHLDLERRFDHAYFAKHRRDVSDRDAGICLIQMVAHNCGDGATFDPDLGRSFTQCTCQRAAPRVLAYTGG